MQNFDTAVKATETSINSAGSAEEENAKVMQGLEKTIQKLKSQFEILINGDGGLKAFMVSVVKLGVDTLKLINSLGGLPTILMAIASALVIIKGQAILISINNLITKLPLLISTIGGGLKMALSDATGAMLLLKEGTIGLGEAISWSMPLIGAIGLAITGVTTIINANKQAEAEAKEKRQEHIKTLQSEIDGIQEAQARIESETLSREELFSILEANIDGYSREEDKLKSTNELRQQAIDLLDEEAKRKAEETLMLNKTKYNEARKAEYGTEKKFRYTDVTSGHYVQTGEGQEYQYDTIEIKAENQEEYIQKLKSAIEDYNKQLDKTNELTQPDAYKNLTTELGKLTTEYEKATTEHDENIATLKEESDNREILGQKVNSLTGRFFKMSEEELEVKKASKLTTEQIKKQIDVTKWSDEAWQAYAEDTGQSVDEAMEALLGLNGSLEDSDDLFKRAMADGKSFSECLSEIDFDTTSLDGLHGAFNALNDALDEINTTGDLSYDKFNALMSQSDEYINVLFDENGQLRDNVDAQHELYEAKVQDMAITKSLELINLAAKYYEENQSLAGLTSQLRDTTSARWDDVNAQMAQLRAQAMSDAYKNINKKRQAKAGTYSSYEDYVNSNKAEGYLDTVAELDEAMTAMQNQINVYKEMANAPHYWEKSAKEGHSGAKEATEKETDALKELENEYKDAVKEVKDAINKEIDKIKEAKNAEVDAIKDRISALEKQKDKEIKAIEDRIKALQKARDAEEKYWDDKIDALKAQNEEQERQNELMKLEEELAKARAKNVMVLGESGHFELRKDDTEVQKAEEALEKKQEEIAYEKKLEELENYKQQALANYDAQIADLESYKDKLEENYNAQIEALKAFQDEREKYYDQQTEALKAQLDELQSSLEDYVDIENKKAEAGADATNSEAKTWNQRLSNLADFVNKYNSLMKKLGDGSTNNKGGGLGTSYSADAISSGNKKEVKGKKATGDSYISEDGAYLVGDDPNKEIIIGSKLNGSLMSLSKGSGVVNAKSTNTLAGVLNQLGSFSRSNFGSGNGTLVNNSNSNAQNITIGSISLPEVKNGKDFVDYLQNFSLNMKQMSFA